jgi:hypothetical protein
LGTIQQAARCSRARNDGEIVFFGKCGDHLTATAPPPDGSLRSRFTRLAWCVHEGGDGLTLDGNPVLVDFAIELLTQRDDVVVLLGLIRLEGLATAELQAKAIEEVKATPVQHRHSARQIIGPKEDCCGKDPLKALHEAAVVGAVLGKLDEVQHLSGGAETKGAALLLQGQGGDPDGNQTILSVGQAKLRVGCNLKKELAVVTGVQKLVFERRKGMPQRTKGRAL